MENSAGDFLTIASGSIAKDWLLVYSFVATIGVFWMTFFHPSNGSDNRIAKAQVLTWFPYFLTFIMSLIQDSEWAKQYQIVAVYIAIIGTWTFDWGAYTALVYNEMITNAGAMWGKVLWYGCINVLSMIITYHFGHSAIFYF